MGNEWSKLDSIRNLSPDWNFVELKMFSTGDKRSFVNGPFGSDLLSNEFVPEGMPVIFIRDIKEGRYQRTSKVCVTEEKYCSLPACQVSYGDLLVTKVGDPPCEAAVYDSKEPGIVTQDVIRIKTDGFGFSSFLSYLLNSDIGKRQVKKIKIAGTRERVSLTDFKTLTLPMPTASEQKKIAQILSTWDQAITATERLLENSRQRKKGLMQQLLTGKKRLPGLEGEWRFISFTDGYSVANQKSSQVKSSEYQLSGSIPVIDQGQNEIAGYCENDSPYTDIPVIIFGDHTRALKWVDFPFCPGADGTQVLKANSILDAKYAYFILSHIELPNLGYSRHMRELKQREFRIPIEIEEQRRIANVLTCADSEIRALSERLDLLSQEKKALMQQLLTGNRRVKVGVEAA